MKVSKGKEVFMETGKFSSITCRELRTGGGQLVEIWCAYGEQDKVLAALKDIKNFEVKIPTTKQVKEINDGKYGQYTRYDVTQVKREGSWLEVLQINDPPDGRCGNILLAWLASTREGRTFFEFDTIENACAAFDRLKKVFGKKTEGEVLKMQGCLRTAKCGILKPWFYAVADQALWGDMVFPDTVKEDEIFRFGRKFVVRDYRDTCSIKTCIGVEHSTLKSSSDRDTEYRRVSWDDGTYADYWEGQRQGWPKPLDESGHLWVQEAMDKFHELLNGVRKNFEIFFRDGSRLVCQWKPKNSKDKTCAGRYKTSLVLENGEKIEGEFNFEPTAEIPTAEDSLIKQAADKGVKIKEIFSLAFCRGGISGKKWAGVF